MLEYGADPTFMGFEEDEMDVVDIASALFQGEQLDSVRSLIEEKQVSYAIPTESTG